MNSSALAEHARAIGFKPNDPRRIDKPVGARMKQITRVRKLLEKAAKLPELARIEFLDIETEKQQITELEAVYLVQLAKARYGDKDAFKAVMDYAGYKPTDHVESENKDVQEFSSEQDIDIELEAIELELQRLQNGENETVEQAQEIVSEEQKV